MNAEKLLSWNVVVTAQGQRLSVKLPVRPLRVGGGARGSITAFSLDSRKRILDTLASIDFGKAGFTCFVTLTYPDGDRPPSYKEADRDRDTFQKRIQRRFPDASAIWRREWEDRKSGDHIGASYPHYHFLVFNLPFVHYGDVNTWWRETLRYGGADLRTEIRGVRGWRQARYYVSKYLAKRKDDAGPCEDGGFPFGTEGEIGEREFFTVAAEGGGEDSPERRAEGCLVADEASGCSLVYGSYLTAPEGQHPAPLPPVQDDAPPPHLTGRHWGIFNRKRLPLAKSAQVELRPGKWLMAYRNEAGRVYEPAGDPTGAGFTLYVDNARDWLEKAKHLALGDAP
jgi:hypothetical protein